MVIAALVAVSGGWLARNTSQALPYVDAFTTWSAVFATWLTAQKAIDNWAWWLVIDLVSIGLYLSRGLPLTALLFVLYVGLIPVGYVQGELAVDIGNGSLSRTFHHHIYR